MRNDEFDQIPVIAVRLPPWTGGAALLSGPGGAVILVDEDLVGRDREAAIRHELEHARRRMSGCAHPRRHVEEREVNRSLAVELIDPAALEDFCEGMADLGLGVTAEDVAEQFDVATWVAEVGLQLLLDARPEGRRTA